jgi:limonene 1,2-monooxygenase
MNRMRFGIFTAPFHAQQGQDPTLAFQRDIETVQLAERLGFDEFWVGEHHSGATELIASPEIFISHVAALTQRIKLGAGVISLPYHNPLWVAERAILLDHLTRGRFMLGLGPGVLASDAAMIGIDPADTRDALQHDVPVLMHLLRSDEPLTVETDRYRLVDARVQLDAYSDFEVAITSIFTPSGPLLAGRFGLGLLQLSGLTQQGMDVLPKHWAVMESQAEKYSTTVSRDAWRVVGLMHLAETKDQAIEDVRFGLDDYFSYLQDTIGVDLYQPAGKTFESRIEWLNETGMGLIGTPAEAIAKLEELQEASQGGIGAFLYWAQEWANPVATAHNYELFARHVRPAFTGSTRRLSITRDWSRENSKKLVERMFAGAERFIKEHEGEIPAGSQPTGGRFPAKPDPE